MKRQIAVVIIAFCSVAISVVAGTSEEAGLFGAIIAVGVFLAGEVKP